MDLLKSFGSENITWGFSECLLVDERAVYATAGGRDAMIVALEPRTGAVVWKIPQLDPAADKLESATYAAPILVQFAGRRLLIGCTQRQLYCADADSGVLQWTRPRPTSYSVLASSPVLVGESVFMAAPHGSPGQLYRLLAPTGAGQPVGVADAWTTPLDTCQGGVVHVDGRLYGSTYSRRGSWQAIDARNGELLYETTEFLKGCVLYADGRLYTLAEDGWMLLLEPTENAFAVRGASVWPRPATATRGPIRDLRRTPLPALPRYDFVLRYPHRSLPAEIIADQPRWGPAERVALIMHDIEEPAVQGGQRPRRRSLKQAHALFRHGAFRCEGELG